MRTTIFLSLVYLLSLPLFSLGASQNYASICQAIPQQTLEHPYLVFSNESKKAIQERIKTDKSAAEIMEVVLREGQRYMLTTVEPELTLNLASARYTETNPYIEYQMYYMQGAHTLAFLYQITGDKAYADRAFYLVDKLCGLESWVQSAHFFENIYGRVWPYGAKDDQVVFSFDHTTGDCSIEVALIYDWLYPALNKAQRDRIRGALLEKSITRVRGNYEFQWWSEAYKCNWAGICHTGLGLGALALLTENPQLVDVVARSCEGVEGMLSHLGADNAWGEGRGYAAYGVGQSIIFVDAIKRASGGKIDLFQMPGLQHPADFALFGLGGSFNDGVRGDATGTSYFYNKMVSESRDPVAMYYLENYLSGPKQSYSLWELIWPRPTDVPAQKPEVASKFFPSVNWAFMRRDFDDRSMQVAVKCAPADDPHHGHLDAGTFNLTWQGETMIGEVEQRSYDLKFFDDLRWEYLYVKSSGHNVVLVEGEEQFSGKCKDQPWQNSAGGTIEKFVSTPQFDYTLMDASKAYPNQHLQSWKRTVVLDKATNIVFVLDRVGCKKGSRIDLLHHPLVSTTVHNEQTATLTGKKAAMKMQPLINSPYRLYEDRQISFRIVKNDAIQFVPCLFTTLEAPAEMNVLGTVFYPASGEKGTEKNARFSLNEKGVHPVMTASVGGKQIRYEITQDGVRRL